ncbi:MAG: transposase [Thermoplasmata archaeon]|nr:transposase [Thermoplasmata archaeon]
MLKDSKVLKVVERHGLKYLAPMEKSDRIKRIANSKDGVNPFYHTQYKFGKENAITNLFFISNGKYEKEKWKNYHVFCTNVDVTKANLTFLADLYGMRWNIENFYRDGENFMIKTKTDDFIARYFFFLFMCIIYNLWYFVREIHPIIAEQWKDFIEDEMRKGKEIEKLLKDYSMYYACMGILINLFFLVTGVSSAYYLIEKVNFCNFK